MSTEIAIKLAASQEDITAVKALFIEYAEWLGVSLCFQGFDEEIATFPSFYDFLLIARVNGEAAGAVGLKDHGQGICEMKRLYVRDAFKRRGLGRRLSEALIIEAKARGFARMRLDTLMRLEAAIALYRDLGFREIPAYYENPEKDVIYMEKAL